MDKIQTHRGLEVYQKAFDAARTTFELSKGFPKEETYSMTDQIRRCSRSVCTNLAEAWRKRRYEAAFISKLSDAEGEAAETQVWVQFSVRCGYMERDIAASLYQTYHEVLATIVGMINHAETWIIAPRTRTGRLSPCHLVTLSPCHLVTLSPCHLVTLSPCQPHGTPRPPQRPTRAAVAGDAGAERRGLRLRRD